MSPFSSPSSPSAAAASYSSSSLHSLLPKLGHDLRYVSSAVSHMFTAFGDVLDLNRRMTELGGFVARVSGSNLGVAVVAYQRLGL